MDKKATAVRKEQPKPPPEPAPAKTLRKKTKGSAGGAAAEKAAATSLAEYERKRDLKTSPEPPAKVGKSKAQPIFVIQQHAATRLHWDFRLEADGVLKSWAITKEPTVDPSVKRLAVRVEDHPLAYADFQGDIPKGSYGAGHVDIWDQGTYEPNGDILSGLKNGKVEVDLHGKKLKGMFALIRMGKPGPKENWLFFKMKDQYAQPSSSLTAAKEGSNGKES
jgi:bifunctional non-homologous end joining protein LigD